MIFESPDNRYPSVEELVLCDLFRNIDLREMRGPSISVSTFSSVSCFFSPCNHPQQTPSCVMLGIINFPFCLQSFKHGLSISTLNLLNAVRRRQGASLSGSHSEGSSPCTPPSTPRRIG